MTPTPTPCRFKLLATGRPLALVACWGWSQGVGAAAQEASPSERAPVVASAASEASAATALPPPRAFNYLLGGKLSAEPAYAGGAGHHWRLMPLWAVQWGRWRFGNGGLGGLLPAAADAGSGATTDLFRGQRLAASLGLRVDGGRSSSDDPALTGLPSVRKTVRLRLAGRWRVWPESVPALVLDSSVSTDLLGRGGGSTASLGLATSGALAAASTWGASLGLGAGDRGYLDARFGVPVAAARPDRAAYEARAGVHEVHAGVGTTTPLSPRWVLLAQLGYSRLLGPAADSPLTQTRGAVHGSLSVVWRPAP